METEGAEAERAIPTSAEAAVLATISVVISTRLFCGFGSFAVVAAVALFLIVPAALELTISWIDALPWLARSPRSQLIFPETAAQLPLLEFAEIRSTPSGSWSVTVTPVAAEGPAFATVIE